MSTEITKMATPSAMLPLAMDITTLEKDSPRLNRRRREINLAGLMKLTLNNQLKCIESGQIREKQSKSPP